MKGYALIWSEDDAPVPDKELLPAAFKRIAELDYVRWLKGTTTIDEGDSFLHVPTGKYDKWLTADAYDGGHIYHRCECRDHEAYWNTDHEKEST